MRRVAQSGGWNLTRILRTEEWNKAMPDEVNGVWLQELFDRAVVGRWCLKINCTTCGNKDIRQALGQSRQRLGPEDARKFVVALRELGPPQKFVIEHEEAIRWMLYEIWRSDGARADNELFPLLEGTSAGVVLQRMRDHYQQRLEMRRIHEARHGVKLRDWKE